jgi:hypothetical protein
MKENDPDSSFEMVLSQEVPLAAYHARYVTYLALNDIQGAIAAIEEYAEEYPSDARA